MFIFVALPFQRLLETPTCLSPNWNIWELLASDERNLTRNERVCCINGIIYNSTDRHKLCPNERSRKQKSSLK